MDDKNPIVDFMKGILGEQEEARERQIDAGKKGVEDMAGVVGVGAVSLHKIMVSNDIHPDVIHTVIDRYVTFLINTVEYDQRLARELAFFEKTGGMRDVGEE